jgi:hypothetical protein
VAVMYIGGLAAALLIMLLLWPLLCLWKRYRHPESENAADLESMCAQLRPGSGHDSAVVVAPPKPNRPTCIPT